MNKTTFPILKCRLCFVLVACAITQSSFAVSHKIPVKDGHSKSSMILPFKVSKLTNFSIIVQSNQTILSWSSIEENNGKYLIYKSDDNRNFAKIGEKIIIGSTKEPSLYIFHDEEPSKGLNYYKLVQQDSKGDTKEVATKVILLDSREPSALINNPIPRINRI